MTGFERLAHCARVGTFSAAFLISSTLCTPPARAGHSAQAASSTQQQFAATPKPSRIQEELRGDALAAEKQYSDAIGVYQGLLRAYPRDAVLLNKIGIAYHQELNMREAKRYYERAVQADPKYASVVNNLGTIEYQRKNYKKAIRLYNKAIAMGPVTGSFYSNLGYAYFSIKQYEPSMTAFRKAIEIDPALFEEHSQSGTVLMERSVEDHAKFFYYVAKSFAQSGDARRCASYLRKARDEGYKQVAAAKTDPAFAAVRNDPEVKEFLDSLTTAEVRPKSES